MQSCLGRCVSLYWEKCKKIQSWLWRGHGQDSWVGGTLWVELSGAVQDWMWRVSGEGVRTTALPPFFSFFWNRVLLCCPEWPWTHELIEFMSSRNPWFDLVSVLGTEHRTSDSGQALYHLSYSSSSKQGLVKLRRPWTRFTKLKEVLIPESFVQPPE